MNRLFVPTLSHGPDKTGTGCEPWLTRDAITLLNSLLKPNMIGLEWGGGSSTAWFRQRLASLHTVEHDSQWAAKVEAHMCAENLLKDWTIYVIPPDQPDPAFMDGNGVTRKTYALAQYIKEPTFDFICVDGRARTACLKTAVNRLALNGILVLDNSDRPYKQEIIVPASWKKIDTSNGVWNTTIWIR
jgi:predicted O-methyltransferase YrrM